MIGRFITVFLFLTSWNILTAQEDLINVNFIFEVEGRLDAFETQRHCSATAQRCRGRSVHDAHVIRVDLKSASTSCVS